MTAPVNADKRRARSEQTREKLLEAAMQCYRRHGVSGTAMEDVAVQAGVGRATLYRHFTNQENLLTNVMAHNTAQLQQLLATSLQGCTLPEEFFVEAALVIIQECHDRGLNTLFFTDESSNSLISRIGISDPTLTTMGNELIEPFYRRAREEGILRDWVTKPLLQEWTSRLLMSFLITPSKHLNSERKMRKFFYDAIMPSIIMRG